MTKCNLQHMCPTKTDKICVCAVSDQSLCWTLGGYRSSSVDSDDVCWTLSNLQQQGPVVQSIVSLMSSLRVISLTVLADSIYNILIFFAEKATHCKSYSHFFSKNFQHVCVSLDENFNELLTNDVVSFEQLGPEVLTHFRLNKLPLHYILEESGYVI